MLKPAEGVYEQLPRCHPSHWLAALEVALQMPEVELRRRQLRVAGPATILAAAAHWASAGDRDGRDVAVSHGTIAQRIGYAEATVKRICRFLTRIGFLVECARGANRLTLEQLHEASELGATQQRAVASTRVLKIPQAVEGTPLPVSTRLNDSSLVQKNSPTRVTARKATASRPPAKTTRPKIQPRARVAVPETPRSVELQRLASRLVEYQRGPGTPTRHQRALPQLLRGRAGRLLHIGALCDVLAAAGIDPRSWQPWEILEAIDRWYADKGRRALDYADVAHPLRYFAWQLGQAIPAGTAPPSAQSAAERDARLARQRAEAEAERARIAAIDQAAVDAVLEQLHREFPRR